MLTNLLHGYTALTTSLGLHGLLAGYKVFCLWDLCAVGSFEEHVGVVVFTTFRVRKHLVIFEQGRCLLVPRIGYVVSVLGCVVKVLINHRK